MGAPANRAFVVLLTGASLSGLVSAGPVHAELAVQGVARRACESALAAEEEHHGPPSRAACYESKDLGYFPEDFRNRVASVMSPHARPNLDDLVMSMLNADAGVNRANNLPWGYLARCDIARRLGNADLMEACLADLERVAPADPVTNRAMGYAREGASWVVWFFRAVLLLGLLGTLAHASWRRRKPARPAVAAAGQLSRAALGILVLLATAAGVARAEPVAERKQGDLSSFPVDDADPVGHLPTAEALGKDPIQLGYFIQDLIARAEKAGTKGDHLAEARFYQALTIIAPNEAYAPRKTCEAYEAAGDLGNAILACRTVLGRPRTNVNDSVHFVDLVLGTKGLLPAVERRELDEVIDHLAKESKVGAVPSILHCQVALRFNDFATLESCANDLAVKAPKDPRTISLQWALALEKHDRSDALALIDRARTVGMNSEGIAQMERATRAMTVRRTGFLFGLVATMMAAVIVFVFVRLRRETARRRLAV
jgi:hypothetical protein